MTDALEPPPAPLSEVQLAASALSLLAQPRLWPGLQRLPAASPALAATQPWTAYWSARLDARLGATAARAVHEAAFRRFDAQGDRVGTWLALAALIETFYVEEGSLQPMDRWIDELQARLPPAGATWPSAELEAQVMACGLAITLRDQTHALLQRWAARGIDLVRQINPGAVRVRLATFLLQYHLWRGEFGQTSLIAETLPGLDVTGLLPGEALVWYESVASHARFTAQHELGRGAIDAALDIAALHGLDDHRYALHAHGTALAIAALDDERAEFHLQAMRPVLDRQPQADQTHYWHLHTGLHLMRGDAARAVESAQMTLANSREIGGPYRTAAHQFSLGAALLAHGDAEGACSALQRAQEQARSIDAALLRFSIGLLESAALARLERPAEAEAALREAMTLGAQHDYRTTSGWWWPEAVAERLAAAIASGIEPAFARRFVRRAGLPCPDPALEDWPWPLRLSAFGEWRVLRDGEPLPASSGRAQQRPFDLLRALLAHDGSSLPVATALEWLWPDGEYDAQRKAFDAALGRLRKLLGDDALLRLEGGQLLLDRRRVWSDVGALGELTHRAAQARSTPQRLAAADALLRLVRGPFLPDAEAPWALAARERLRRRFVVAVGQLAEGLEGDAPDAAVRLYERALDVDPLAESLYRRLMRLQARRGETAEALRTWHHCKTMLELAGGLRPGSETTELARQLGLA